MSLVNEPNEKLGKSVPFILQLYAGESADQLSPVDNGIEIDEKTSKLEVPCGGGISYAQVNVKILKPAGVSLFNARKFFLVAQPALSKHFESVSYGYSDPLVAVNYRLVITNGHELPSIYYNATKGKGNKMEIRVRLVDSQGKAVLDRPNLKLNFVLHYEDNTTVDQSEKKMLEIASDSKLFIGETGEAVVRFRIINAVSRKHGNKRFKVSVSADSVQNAARFNDVSFDYSPSIDVRTKVDEKARARRMAKKQGLPCPDETALTAQPAKRVRINEDLHPTAPPLERPLSISSYMDLSSLGPPSFLSYAQGSFGSSALSVQPTFGGEAKTWAQVLVEKVEKLRWKKVDGKTPIDKGDTIVHEGYEFCNPNAVIDEIIAASQKFLNNSSDSIDFDKSCQEIAEVPVPSRAHSLAYNIKTD